MPKEIKTGNELAEFLKDPKPAVIHFHASWAPSCTQVNQFLDDYIEDTNLEIRTAYLEAESLPGVALNYNVTAAPTLIFFHNGKEIERVNGFIPAEIKEKLVSTSTYASSSQGGATLTDQQKKDLLNERLKKLINKNRVMLFMKGSPEAPRCGFSRKTVELLNSKNIEYGSFDILSDEDVRQGLKEFSNWPTYPQLYFDGELVGGLDVIKEEFENDSFVEKLPKVSKTNLEDRLRQLTRKSRLMLFMKGTRESPRCGFSRQIVELLNNAKADYETFDILSDEEVRQGLKDLFNWPTYPQLYLDGELVGGLDVVKEELLDTHFLRQIPRVGRD
ncbi:unnamed protein product [Caenorhabditis bovis]|uniref:Uncharacterized protein n=1 Tax=Caenorhabditis bovis TaxID=2654633 RepID=A0A8S1EDK0_9PELO|nr:unnamed protein product [Caenorhabditis bovis]